ncbi:hypothetical protein QPL79_02835 [Ignisphaera sp. 4213-co]|uniref:Restriction endonuclease type IV Mrr domain-containing protein n=1 Tax=Ignisphaera cupida TaxID=3050454 RepID=A0ABD4Z870_9CREN|nr:hypothetical protein [Ignisphaera sp. 4213-co]MDK6028298.1 hypothetical protein [Ignisphaera sp. 4213-co]
MSNYIMASDLIEHLFKYKKLDVKLKSVLKSNERNNLENLIAEGLKEGFLISDDVYIYLEKPVEFLLLIEEKMPIDITRFANYIEWREFEEYIIAKLRTTGLDYTSSYTHKRISHFQIDVLAIDVVKGIGFIIECKHWRRRIGGFSIAKIVEDHMTRIDKFLKHCEWVASDIPVIRKVKFFIPIIITLYTSATWAFKGIPIVSLRFLNDFLSNIDVYMDSLELKRIENRCYVK